MKQFVGIILASTLLSACSLFQDNADNDHAAVCNELKRQIIYNGTTQNQVRTSAGQPLATQQRAQLDKANASYDQLGC